MPGPWRARRIIKGSVWLTAAGEQVQGGALRQQPASRAGRGSAGARGGRQPRRPATHGDIALPSSPLLCSALRTHARTRIVIIIVIIIIIIIIIVIVVIVIIVTTTVQLAARAMLGCMILVALHAGARSQIS
eukprot:COSAG01_NODE_8255_length_2855_cov_5.639695_1_plen_132_part_00